MTKAEAEVKAEVEVRTINTTRPDEVVRRMKVDSKGQELFETDVNPVLRALSVKKIIIVEAGWPNEFAYGINQQGTLADNPHYLKEGEEMHLRAKGLRGIVEGIPDSSKITHIKPKSKKMKLHRV